MLCNEMSGAPERIRTSDPQIRSLVLYPAELRALVGDASREARIGRRRSSIASDLPWQPFLSRPVT